jgi:hypothetical protein
VTCSPAAVRVPAAAVAMAVLLTGMAGCTAEPDTVLTAQVSAAPPPVAVATVTATAPVTATVTVTAAPEAAPAPPDPTHAGPDPAPAAPDPAPARPDTAPAAPDPAPARPDTAPAGPDTAPTPADRPALPDLAPFTAAAARTPSAVALACDAVQEALADGVVRYEVQALSEEGLSGGVDRSAAWTDMGTAMENAARAAAGVPGLAAAAAPAMTELAALRDGMTARTDLDEDDAGPWRAARNELESWCDGQD